MGASSSISPATCQNNYDIESTVLSTGESMSAFLKYLEGNGKGSILTWYLDILEYKLTEPKNLLLKATKIRLYYDDLVNKSEDTKTVALIWRSVDQTLPLNINSKTSSGKFSSRLDDAKNLTLSLLSKEVKCFRQSQYYNELRATVNRTDSVDWKRLAAQKNNDLRTTTKQIHCHVLVMEESPLNSSRMTTYLEANGHFVCQAHHGRVGIHLAIASGINFGVILIDMTMKTMDPLDVAKQLKAHFNGTISFSKPHQLLQSKSVRLPSFRKPNFLSSRTSKRADKVLAPVKITDNIGQGLPILISLVKNNPTYRFNKNFFQGFVSAKTFTDSDIIVDMSFLTLIFEFDNIIRGQVSSSREHDRVPSSLATSNELEDSDEDKRQIPYLNEFFKLIR